MLAQKLGFPFAHFIASNNANNVVERYFKTNTYFPLPSIQTISNAMDVGNPSNFVRIQKLHDNNFEALKNNLTAYSFSDEQTKEALSAIYKGSGYIADPHGAVGYLGCKSYREKNPAAQTIFLETAHPTKFLDVVEAVIPEKIALPPQIQAVIEKEKSAIFVEDYSQFKTFLLNF